jgi:hypothetical protein
MELEKLQVKGIDRMKFFKEPIKKEIEDLFIAKYKKLGISGLTESFFIDLKKFETILSENDKPFCKFYFIQNGLSLNLGLSFSDNEDCAIKINNRDDDDALYVLDDNLIKKDFRNMKTDFVNGIGTKLPLHPGDKKDTLISYSLEEINGYLQKMKDLYSNINSLKFNMWQYCPTKLDDELSAEFTKRNNRISFCVHVLFNKSGNLYGEGAGYDLGNLRP